MKYLVINLLKCAQDLYEEHYKALMKEVTELNTEEKYSIIMDRKTQYC